MHLPRQGRLNHYFRIPIDTSSLVSTSVSDCKITLRGALQSDPIYTAWLCLALLGRLVGAEGHAQRRQVAARTLRNAGKAIAESQKPDPKGPAADDLYATLPVSDLRKLLEQPVRSHFTHCADLIETLTRLRGEPQCDSRRKLLLTALGKSARALMDDQEQVAA
jgi:hypothetical protein